jgi:hypothetical protein
MRITEADLRRSGFDLQASALKRTQSDLLALSGQSHLRESISKKSAWRACITGICLYIVGIYR